MRLRSVAPMRTAKIGYIVVSALMCVLGVFLMVKPDFSASALGVLCGVLMIVFGLVRLTGYFSKDLYRLAFQYDLVFGVLLIALGIIMLVRPGSLMNFICIALGLYILIDGLFKLQIANEARSFGVGNWWLIMTFAIVTAVCGFVLLFRPGDGSRVLMTVFGISLLAEGVLNLSTAVTAVKIVKHQKPDVIEVDYTEERED